MSTCTTVHIGMSMTYPWEKSAVLEWKSRCIRDDHNYKGGYEFGIPLDLANEWVRKVTGREAINKGAYLVYMDYKECTFLYFHDANIWLLTAPRGQVDHNVELFTNSNKLTS